MEETTTPRSFVRTILPWLLAACMLVVYAVTLSKDVTLANVPAESLPHNINLARVVGLDWHPTFVAPLSWAVTSIVRLLPNGAQLVGLNFIGALCAALTLALLARSVALLPHDRTHEQRVREQSEDGLLSLRLAWIPPVFAVLLLGLQRTFWENAIICTGEMIDALVIAYVIRCFLEHRLDQRDAWLWKMSFVYGLGITNNFALIVFAPVVVVALIWLKKLRLFEYGFLVRLAGFGVLGLCLYLLLPAVQTMNDAADTTFWQALRVNLGYQKQIIFGFPRWRAYWLGGYPLVLLLMIAINWASGWGDTSRIGGIVGTAMAHVLHVTLLAFVVYMALDLPASPRHLGLGFSFLGSYYISALAAGYFVGYLLLVFSDFDVKARRPRAPAIMGPLSYIVTALVVLATIALPVTLVINNWPRIAALNETAFRDYAAELVESLPKQPAVVMSDDPTRLYAAGLLGARQQGHLLIESHSLTNSAYLRFLKHRYGNALPSLQTESLRGPLPASAPVALLSALKQSREIFYLHPSFGFFFETFYLEPHDLVYRLETYPTNSIEAPVPPAEVIARQAEMWNRMEPKVREIGEKARLLSSEKQTMHGNFLFAAQSYSVAMDWWAVELQRAGRFDEAMKFLDNALVANADNSSAFITREANIEWRKNHRRLDKLSPEAEAKLKKTVGIELLLNTCGPVDEPSFRAELMQIFAGNLLWRQAAQQILRALTFAPDDAGYQIGLANVYVGWSKPDRALAVAREVRSKHSVQSLTPPVAVDLARTEAAANFARSDFPAAEGLLKATLRQYPEQDGAYLALSELYVAQAEVVRRAGNTTGAQQMISNALSVAEQQIAQQPQNANAHFNHGSLCMYVPDFRCAIDAFSKVLEIDPKNFAALLNRAIANLQSKSLDDAQRDYEKLAAVAPTSFRVYYGLAEIAYQKKNWKQAKTYYERYLKFAPANSEESNFVKKRIAELNSK